MNVEEIIREYVNKTVHMSLATSRDNKPWVCEVHFAYDQDLNLYFVSKLETRHCQEIASNPVVAGNIVKQHELTELPHGIYFEGQAEAITEPTEEDIDRYCQRLGRNSEELAAQLKAKDERAMFKISVKNWAAFGKFDGDALAKYELEWHKS
jgi:uncharacterized protein YhbP (UPF0306 family)